MSAPGPLIVEARLGRIEALTLALECVAAHANDQSAAADACGWLRIMAKDELDTLKALGPSVLNLDT